MTRDEQWAALREAVTTPNSRTVYDPTPNTEYWKDGKLTVAMHRHSNGKFSVRIWLASGIKTVIEGEGPLFVALAKGAFTTIYQAIRS